MEYAHNAIANYVKYPIISKYPVISPKELNIVLNGLYWLQQLIRNDFGRDIIVDIE